MTSVRNLVRIFLVTLFVAAMSKPTIADEALIGQLKALLTERPNPEASASFAFALDGCILTRSILHDKEKTCSRSRGGWYRWDHIIDLRLLRTSPYAARVRSNKYNWEQIVWPFRSGIAKERREYLQDWYDRHKAILKEDMALPEYDLARRMDKLRALIDEMFPNRRFSGHSQRIEYCGAGMLHSPTQFWMSGDVRLALLPVGNGEKVVELIHRYAQRQCTSK